MPSISLHSQNVAVSLKQNITIVSFACKVTRSPPPVITWLKNNSTQPNATVLEIDGLSWLILVLVGKQNSEDRYICAARNSVGETYSTEAMVIITVPGADNSLSAVTALPIPGWLVFRIEVGYRGYLPNKESDYTKVRGISKGLTDCTYTRGIKSMEIDDRKTNR